MSRELTKVINDSGLEKIEVDSIMSRFGSYENIVSEWDEKARSIVVKNKDQLTEMAMAKEARKKFSQMRIDIEKARKEMKEQSLRKGQAIDSVARYLTSLVKPIEDYLKEQENFIEIQEANRLEVLRIEEEKKVEEERITKEKSDIEEQKRIIKENRKLKIEALRQKKEIDKAEKKFEEVEKLLVAEKGKVEEKLKDLIKCPHCGEEFSIEGIDK